jgi:hypothetical protein
MEPEFYSACQAQIVFSISNFLHLKFGVVLYRKKQMTASDLHWVVDKDTKFLVQVKETYGGKYQL